MLDFINACFGFFSDFVLEIFRLPFYGSLSLGYALLGMSVLGIVVVYFLLRIK